MAAVTFAERLEGRIAFDQTDFNQALLAGRRAGTRLTLRLRLRVDDPRRVAHAEGEVLCPELGGRLAVEDGRFELFVDAPDARHLRMRYLLLLRDPLGRPLTLNGFKVLEDDPTFDSWSDSTTLFVRLFAGHLAAGEQTRERLVATGVVRIGAVGLVRLLASLRGAPADVARFGAFFARGLGRTYRGRAVADGRPSFPVDPAALIGVERAGAWAPVEERPGLERRIVRCPAQDGVEGNLHHLRRAGAPPPTRGPVLLAHGTGVRAQLFYGQPSGATIAEALLDEGYDVWSQSWRGSIDFPPNPYGLDRVGRYDHPAAVATVLAETGRSTLKAVVHCQGSVSFVMAAAAGLVPEVTHVVSSAVSLHIAVPRLTRVKQRTLLPLAAGLMPYADAQWTIRPPSPLARGLAGWARLVRRECDEPVCKLANFMYGTGPEVLWRHANLEPDVHAWAGREFGWAPFRLIAQISRGARAGSIVPVESLPDWPESFVDRAPRTDARFTFVTGTENRLFLPEGQERTYRHFARHAPGRHRFVAFPGYAHLDPFFGRDAATDTFPAMLAGLEA